MKGSVQCNPVYGWEDFTSSEDRTQSARSVGQRLTHCATGLLDSLETRNTQEKRKQQIRFNWVSSWPVMKCATWVTPLATGSVKRNVIFKIPQNEPNDPEMCNTGHAPSNRLSEAERNFQNTSEWTQRS